MKHYSFHMFDILMYCNTNKLNQQKPYSKKLYLSIIHIIPNEAAVRVQGTKRLQAR